MLLNATARNSIKGLFYKNRCRLYLCLPVGGDGNKVSLWNSPIVTL